MSIQKSIERGQLIFKEGKNEKCMYKVVHGKVGIYKEYETPEELLLTELTDGRIFGEMGLIDYLPRSATAVAIEDTVLEVIEDEEFVEYLNHNPEEMFQILDAIAVRTRELTKDFNQVRTDLSEYAKAEGLDVEPSLMKRLLRFAGIGKIMQREIDK